MSIENNCRVTSAEHLPRRGWEERFRAAGTSVHDELLFETTLPSDFDRKEWQWQAVAPGLPTPQTRGRE